MNFWPMVVKPVFGVFSEQKHGSQRCNPQLVDFFARIQQAFHIHNGCFACLYHKFISAGNTWAVKESINGYRIGSPGRTFDPEFPENRKFFTGLYCCVNRQPAGGKPVLVPLPQRAEIARAQKRNHFVKIRQAVQRIMQAEPGIAAAPDFLKILGRNLVLAVVEKFRMICQRHRLAVDNLVNRHRRRKHPADMEQLQVKLQLVLCPRPVRGFEADVAVFVIVEPAEFSRRQFCRLLVRGCRHRLRFLPQFLKRKFPRRGNFFFRLD